MKALITSLSVPPLHLGCSVKQIYEPCNPAFFFLEMHIPGMFRGFGLVYQMVFVKIVLAV